MSGNTITILQLYPRDMNIYGDNGNLLTLKNYIKSAGFEVAIIEHNPGDNLPEKIDIVLGGGGQDSGQDKIHADLLKNSAKLKDWSEQGVPMLMICGMYQLFGNFFETLEGKKLQGIGIFDIETHGSTDRLIGNIVTESKKFGKIIGYENHSGQTILGPKAEPLGRTIKGYGNNSKEATKNRHEGAIYKNTIGTYLHGPILPKNPQITKFLVEKALKNKSSEKSSTVGLKEVANSIYLKKAREIAESRPS